MKTIQTRKGEISRVANNVADEEVKSGRAQFVPKKLWKTEVRDVGKTDEAVAEPKAKPAKRKKEGQ